MVQKNFPEKNPLTAVSGCWVSIRDIIPQPKAGTRKHPTPTCFLTPPSENVWEFQSSQLEKLSWMTGTLHGNLTHFFVLEFMGQAGQPGHEDFLAHIVSFPPILLVLVILVYIG